MSGVFRSQQAPGAVFGTQVQGAPPALPTLVRPVSTVSAGAWTPTGAATLHGAINEAAPSEAEFISTSVASTCVMLFDEAAFPGGSIQAPSYRASSTLGSAVTITLRQGATVIMTRTQRLTATETLYTHELTAPEIALITAGPVTVELTAAP